MQRFDKVSAILFYKNLTTHFKNDNLLSYQSILFVISLVRFAQSAVSAGDFTRIADESSLLIMDIVVELEGGSIANVEMQKIGYLFSG